MKNFSTENNPFDFFDRIFCVNLDSRPDRWKECLVEFDKLGIKDRVERQSGVVLDTDHFMKGRAGAASSFRKIWERVDEEGSENVLILEDDVIFTDEALETLSKSTSDLESRNWDMFYLGVSVEATLSKKVPPFERMTNSLLRARNSLCLHAVAYNASILGTLLGQVPDERLILNWIYHNLSIDGWIMNKIQAGNFDVFCTDPMIATQRPSFSDIDHNEATWGQNLINAFNQFVPPKHE